MDAFQQIGPRLLASTEGAGSGEPSLIGFYIYLGITLAILFALMAYAKKGFGVQVFKNPVSQWFEQLFLFIENMCLSTIGPHGRKYMTFIMTLWMVIFLGNILALVAPFSPTADLSFNLGMAVLSVVYVQWEGIKANGLFGHLKHFTGPKLTGIMVILSGLIFIIEIISEAMKNLSLSLRLYGNIHGGHAAVSAMNALGDKIYVPIGALVLLLLKLLTCVIQALIFTMLTCVYLSLVTHHEDDHEAEHGQPAHAH